VLPVPATKEYVNVFPTSGSVVLNVPMVVFPITFSLTELADREISVGATLGIVTTYVLGYNKAGEASEEVVQFAELATLNRQSAAVASVVGPL